MSLMKIRNNVVDSRGGTLINVKGTRRVLVQHDLLRKIGSDEKYSSGNPIALQLVKKTNMPYSVKAFVISKATG